MFFETASQLSRISVINLVRCGLQQRNKNLFGVESRSVVKFCIIRMLSPNLIIAVKAQSF